MDIAAGIVGRCEVVGGIGDDPVPTIVTRPGLQRAHQAQLKPIPAGPQLGFLGANSRAQQRKTARAQILRLVDPGDLKALQRLDGFSSVMLHAAEDNDAVAGRCDLVAVDSELVAEAQRRDLAFDQALGGLRQRPLGFANADRRRAALGLAGLDQQLPEECDFPEPRPPYAPL